MKMSSRGFRALLPLLLFLAALAAHAQQGESPVPGGETSESAGISSMLENARVLTAEQNRIEMEIKTSTLSELAVWCRSLGLPEGGTAADLARRLREFFKLSQQADSGQADTRKIITIESARRTEYFTIEAVNEEYARLSGEVRISLKDGDAIHRIRAWNILFNRTRNIITASGGVEYTKEEGEKIETFRGESITVDLDNWSSIFLGGVSERSLQNDNTTYLFAGTVISRDNEEVTTLNRATISSAGGEESLWSLSASRVWLLPGSDFAIFNAVLKVGEVPVLYIPFFYYAADEVIFHPVIGFRTREGGFVQTTTYILGRPKAESSSQSSLTKILGSSNDMEKRREGMFLRSTGKKATDPNTISLVAMLDHYANLGTYIGADLSLPAKGVFGALDLSAGIGLTRTIAVVNGSYTPFFPTYDGKIDWNHSNLFSIEVPFRYRFRASSSISGKLGTFSWSIPYYSDPLVDSDFISRRSTEMDWINMIQQGAAMEAEELSQSYLPAYSWNFNVSPNLKFPNMSPYITGINIGSISTSISFATVDKRSTYGANNIKYYSPSSFYFAPSTATLYSLSGSIAGNPLSFGMSAASQAPASGEQKELPDSIKNIGIPRSPFEEPEKEEAQKASPADVLVPPALTQRFDLPRIGNTQLSINYNIAPASASTLKFDSGKWKESSDINWGDVSSIVTNFSGNASVSLSFAHTENIFSNNFTYSFNGNWRQYSYLNEEAEEFLTSGTPDPARVSDARRVEYSQSNFSTTYSNTVSIRPLYRNSIFGSSNLQYNLGGLAVKSNFIGTGDDPNWEMVYGGDWDKEKINIHSLSGNIAATFMEKSQSFTVTADLPPRDSALSFNTSLNIWITQTTANWKVLFPGEEDKRKLEPFTATERINFGTFGSFSQNLTLDTELKELVSLNSSLTLSRWGISASYAATRMLGYEYIPGVGTGTGWVQRSGDENLKLRSRDFQMSFNKSFNVTEIWQNRLNFSIHINSRLYLDLQRYTNSSLSFGLGFTLEISKFLVFTLSTNSENSMIYRYFKDLPIFSNVPIDIPDGPQNNFFLDLFNSFRFDNEELRKMSGFKMQNFKISATHYLGDWNAVLNWSMAPYRPAGSRQFEINNEVSFLLQWVPISEIKSDISYNRMNRPKWTVK